MLCFLSEMRDSHIWKEYKTRKHDNTFKNMVQSNIYSISLDKIFLLFPMAKLILEDTETYT